MAANRTLRQLAAAERVYGRAMRRTTTAPTATNMRRQYVAFLARVRAERRAGGPMVFLRHLGVACRFLRRDWRAAVEYLAGRPLWEENNA